jgi:hypothetical protein
MTNRHRQDPELARRRERASEPPTLPLPPLWRLIVAALIVIGFLYLMYRTAG